MQLSLKTLRSLRNVEIEIYLGYHSCSLSKLAGGVINSLRTIIVPFMEAKTLAVRICHPSAPDKDDPVIAIPEALKCRLDLKIELRGFKGRVASPCYVVKRPYGQ